MLLFWTIFKLQNYFWDLKKCILWSQKIPHKLLFYIRFKEKALIFLIFSWAIYSFMPKNISQNHYSCEVNRKLWILQISKSVMSTCTLLRTGSSVFGNLFWILDSMIMRFGQILAHLMTNFSTIFKFWGLETSIASWFSKIAI